MHFSIINCLCYEMSISTHMSEDQVLEERNTDLNGEKDIRMTDIMEEHWRDATDYGEDNINIHALRSVCTKENEDLVNRYFSVAVPHPEGGGVNIIE